MKFVHLVLRNLGRKKMRTALTLGSFAVSLFLFGVLMIIDTSLNPGVDIAGAKRLIVLNKVSIIQPLPFAYGERISRIEGVDGVTFAVWFGGTYQDRKNFFPNFAVDPESYLEIYREYAIPAQQRDAFLADRQGCVVGRDLIDRFGWKLGDRVPLEGMIWTGTWEFNIRAIYDPASNSTASNEFWFHYDYLEEQRPFFKGTVGWYVVRVRDSADAPRVAAAVDEGFANSPWETKTDTEQAFAASWANQIGNIRLLITTIGGVVFFTLLLVTGNTMAISVRERTGEFGVLKTVGFTDAGVLALVLAESLLVALIGGAAGLALAKAFTLRGDPTGGMLSIFLISGSDLGLGLAIAAGAGIVAGIVPAVTAMRLRIVDALRRV